MARIGKTSNDICWEIGLYNSSCDCSMCEHKYECSGSPYDTDECEDDEEEE